MTSMLPVLHLIEAQLPQLLWEGGWRSKKIDYTPPVVDRLYRDVVIDKVSYRVYLHRIYPCERAFFHPHPWPSAVRVIGGENSVYEMGVGFGPNDRHDPPPHAAILKVEKGFEYTMDHPDGWHYVKINGSPSISLMVSGPVWNRPGGAPRTERHEFKALTYAECTLIVEPICKHYKLTLAHVRGVWDEAKD